MRGLVFLEQRLETPDHFRLFPVEVAALGEVVPQIVESAGELVCYVAALLLEPVRLAGMGSVAVAVAAGQVEDSQRLARACFREPAELGPIDGGASTDAVDPPQAPQCARVL